MKTTAFTIGALFVLLTSLVISCGNDKKTDNPDASTPLNAGSGGSTGAAGTSGLGLNSFTYNKEARVAHVLAMVTQNADLGLGKNEPGRKEENKKR
jgi:hypothetical protein